MEFYDYVKNPPKMGQMARLAVERCRKMLKSDDYWLDEKAVLKIYRMFSILKFGTGAFYNKPFELLPYQKFVLANIYGMKKAGSDRRMFTRAYISMARKSGKSEFAGALGLYHTWFDGEGTPECYTVANKYEQSIICWSSAKRMAQILAKESKQFRQSLKVYDSIHTRRLQNKDNDGVFAPLAAKSKTLDGLRPSFVIIDEYHEAMDDSVLRVMQTGMVGRVNPLLLIITTRGFNTNGPCSQYEKVMVDILRGQKTDDSSFTMIFSLDSEDNWDDEDVWYKANPGLGNSVSMEALQAEYTRAENEGATALLNFKVKNLNQWVKQSKAWIPYKKWMDCPDNDYDLEGRMCYAGIDLASNYDLTAVTLFFPNVEIGGHKEHVLRTWCFAPEEGAQRRSARDGVPYLEWSADDHLTLTPGSETDYSYVLEKIRELGELYDIQMIGYDPWNTAAFAQRLREHGIPTDKVGQTPSNMHEPLNYLERWISKGMLNHGGNPILEWAVTNAAIRVNATGLRMLDKNKSTERIDPIVAGLMAIACYLEDEQGDPVVEILIA